MATAILFPKIGFTMEEGTLSGWLVEDGAQVREGEPLFTLETDKSVMEIEAPATGRIRISAQAGEVYPIGTILGEIE